MKKIIIILTIGILFACKSKENYDTEKHNKTTEKPHEISDKESKIDLKSGKIVNISGNQDIKKLLTGKGNYNDQTLFTTAIPDKYASKEITYLRIETLDAFLEMAEAAENDGILLKIVSGARGFDRQKRIWERKWNNSTIENHTERALDILKFSSMPMTSRHHWGTDIDLNNLENSYFESGEGLRIYKWLAENAPKYGFCQVYSDKMIDGRKGYEMEKWHWSYMPLAEILLKEYNRSIKYENITGFLGSDKARELNIINDFVNGIEHCQD